MKRFNLKHAFLTLLPALMLGLFPSQSFSHNKVVVVPLGDDLINCLSGTLVGSRWCNLNDGTVKDMTSGLIWLRDANCLGLNNWIDGIEQTTSLANGSCNLSDGSSAEDWRLATASELNSLVNGKEAVRASQMRAFIGVSPANYWTSSVTYGPGGATGRTLDLTDGGSGGSGFNNNRYVWPVRTPAN